MSIGEILVRESRQAAARAWFEREGDPCHVKLCGMFRDADIAAVNECLPDMAGFVVNFPPSHRSVKGKELGRLVDQLDERIYSVAVTVDLSIGYLGYVATHYVDVLQLHGHEDADFVHGLQMRTKAPIIQAFRVREKADVERALASTADMILLDAGQGSGECFDWSLVEGVHARRPFILAGGLTPDNVAEAVRTLHPWGVDMSSGIETDRVKDPAKMAAAVAAVRSCNG